MLIIKNAKNITLIALLLVLIVMLSQGLILACFAVLACAYVIYELLGTDHIHYDVRQDYDYRCLKGVRKELTISDNVICIPENYQHLNSSVLLEIDCESSTTGFLFDPFIEIYCGEQSVQHYLERGFAGKRYLNIGHLPLNASKKILCRFKHCRLRRDSCHIISMVNPDISTKKILIISPHPDDAEIAAFGLYSSHNSIVVTITAGESAPDSQYLAMTGNAQKATLLKGQLRAWNSIVVPLWAGLGSDKVINLGYPDSSLNRLHNHPETLFPSEFQASFRQFNTIKLSTDHQQSISWQSLVKDLSDIIRQFKPDVIVTPHAKMDAHQDHQLSTQAIKQAVFEIQQNDVMWLYYINHLPNTDSWPFGPHSTAISPPPGMAQVDGFYSLSLAPSVQIKKACSLEMMHDLRKPIKLKHQLRYWLQQKLLGRKPHPLGKDPYFRKSIRSNELFIIDNKLSSMSDTV